MSGTGSGSADAPGGDGGAREEDVREGAALEGVVREVGGGVYRVALDDGAEVEASLRGRLKLERRTGDRVVVGDRVRLEWEGDDATVEEVLPRENEIIRAGPAGRKPRVVAANVDRVLVVVAAGRPEPRPELIDRLLVVAEAEGVTPVLVVNKVDLAEGRPVAEELADRYRAAGYRVHLVSAETGDGIEILRGLLSTGISVLVGPSGAGKSTLLNRIEPALELRTGPVGRKRGSGRHTTVSARLVSLEAGGAVADTPGFSEVGLWEVDPAGLDLHFPEFRTHRERCRFRGCSHLHEPECGVRGAVEEGLIAEARFESYRALHAEAEEAATRW